MSASASALAAELHGLLDRYMPCDPHTAGLGELAVGLVELQEGMNRLQAVWLNTLAAFDARAGWSSDSAAAAVGIPAAINSTVWLRRACHLTGPAANVMLRLARALRTLPSTAAAMGTGQMTVDHARVIAATVAEVREPLTASGGQFLPEAAAEIARASEDTVQSRNHRIPDEPDPTDRCVEGSPVGCAEGVLVRAGRLLDELGPVGRTPRVGCQRPSLGVGRSGLRVSNSLGLSIPILE
jgi:hypothetical protein